MEMVECQHVLDLVGFAGRNLALGDAAEMQPLKAKRLAQAPLRAFFSSMPETPSRRRNSASTSSTDRPKWDSRIRE
jgi:hypothetical protein